MKYNKAQHVESRRSGGWKPTVGDCFKVNFDGAFSVHEKKGGVGIIIRNSEGEVMGTLATSISLVTNHLLVKAIMGVKVLEFAKDMGFTKIILEGDSISVINRLCAH
ncbi:hypothetical protein PTKIN_Ptkin05aG0083200 [Pterospermum kingtungense]